MVLDFRINRLRGRPRKKWRRQVEEEIKKTGMSEKDSLNRLKWREVLKLIVSH